MHTQHIRRLRPPRPPPFAPVGAFVVLLPDASLSQHGAIHLVVPKSQYRGVIVAVGPDADADLAVGDYVAYANFLTTVEVGTEAWMLVHDDDVLCRLADG